jgi:gliding motility-associated-like protein
MKSCFFLILICIVPLSFTAQAQGNKKPRIVGQDELSTREDESITILMTHLDVEDPDDWFYPWGFTMTIHAGNNYNFQGNVVTPAQDFHGKLMVGVTVNDGLDESAKHNLEITVYPTNDQPAITGHATLVIDENQSLTIQPSHLEVADPDNKWPEDFTIKPAGGSNYSVNGHTITPQHGFSGTLSVSIIVNDGQVDSEPYLLPIEVKAINRVPVITGHRPLQVEEDGAIVIQLSDLVIVDEDSNYPQGFSLQLSAGSDYSISNSTVTPAADFFGKISVPVTVNDGTNTSKPFDVVITVTPANDLPEITDFETDPLFYNATNVALAISHTVTITDPDADSIMFAEIGIRPEGYRAATDKLAFNDDADGKIRGVFDPNTGILTLLGQASPARYSRAIRAVQYSTLAPEPGGIRTLYVMVNDGRVDSEVAERSIVFGQAALSLDIPTGFTPNGDLSNDTWKIIPLKSEEEFSGARIKVYNKAGILVYESIGFDTEWDGRLNGELLPADTYFYTIDLNLNVPEGYLKGIVTILR